MLAKDIAADDRTGVLLQCIEGIVEREFFDNVKFLFDAEKSDDDDDDDDDDGAHTETRSSTTTTTTTPNKSSSSAERTDDDADRVDEAVGAQR